MLIHSTYALRAVRYAAGLALALTLIGANPSALALPMCASPGACNILTGVCDEAGVQVRRVEDAWPWQCECSLTGCREECGGAISPPHTACTVPGGWRRQPVNAGHCAGLHDEVLGVCPVDDTQPCYDYWATVENPGNSTTVTSSNENLCKGFRGLHEIIDDFSILLTARPSGRHRSEEAALANDMMQEVKRETTLAWLELKFLKSIGQQGGTAWRAALDLLRSTAPVFQQLKRMAKDPVNPNYQAVPDFLPQPTSEDYAGTSFTTAQKSALMTLSNKRRKLATAIAEVNDITDRLAGALEDWYTNGASTTRATWIRTLARELDLHMMSVVNKGLNEASARQTLAGVMSNLFTSSAPACLTLTDITEIHREMFLEFPGASGLVETYSAFMLNEGFTPENGDGADCVTGMTWPNDIATSTLVTKLNALWNYHLSDGAWTTANDICNDPSLALCSSYTTTTLTPLWEQEFGQIRQAITVVPTGAHIIGAGRYVDVTITPSPGTLPPMTLTVNGNNGTADLVVTDLTPGTYSVTVSFPTQKNGKLFRSSATKSVVVK